MHPNPVRPRTESRALTGLRGLAALLIVCHHIYLYLAADLGYGLAPVIAPLESALIHSYLAVDLFFVLSGFVLAMTYGHWFDATRPLALSGYLRFISRRIARLWPLHVAIIVILVLLGFSASGHTVKLRSLLMNVAMLQTWGFSAEINPPTWSISTEFLASILFPALALLTLRGRIGPALCAAGILLGIAVCITGGAPIGPARRGLLDLYGNYTFLPAIRCLSGFSLGMLAWRAGRIPRLQALAKAPAAGPLALAAAALLLLAGAPELVIYATFPAIVLGLHYGHSPVHRILAQRPVHTMGVLSYAIYVIHFELLLHFPLGWAPTPLVILAFALATLALAALAHALIETPGRQLIRRAGEALLALAPNPINAARLKPTLHDGPP